MPERERFRLKRWPTRTRTRTNTIPNDTKANAAVESPDYSPLSPDIDGDAQQNVGTLMGAMDFPSDIADPAEPEEADDNASSSRSPNESLHEEHDVITSSPSSPSKNLTEEQNTDSQNSSFHFPPNDLPEPMLFLPRSPPPCARGVTRPPRSTAAPSARRRGAPSQPHTALPGPRPRSQKAARQPSPRSTRAALFRLVACAPGSKACCRFGRGALGSVRRRASERARARESERERERASERVSESERARESERTTADARAMCSRR